MLTTTDLLEIERKARAYQAEEAANPEAKTCHRPTPELVLRLVEEVRESDRRSQEQLDFVSQIKEGKYEDARKAGIELASELTKERDDLRAKVAHLDSERIHCANVLEYTGGLLEKEKARVRELQAIVDRLPKTADGVPVCPQMWVYIPIPNSTPLAIKATDFTGDLSSRYSYTYSTREAALAAQATKGGAQ